MKTNGFLTSTLISLVFSTGLALAVQIENERYTYDASGNITRAIIGDVSTDFEYTNGDVLTRSIKDREITNYLYDDDGRLLSERSTAKTGRNYSYGNGDKILEIVDDIPERERVKLFHNHSGRYLGKFESGRLEQWAWDGDLVISKGQDKIVGEEHRTGGSPIIQNGLPLVADHNANSLALGDSSQWFTAFGITFSDEASVKGFFSGKAYDSASKAYVFHHRILRTDIQRWTSVDPIGFPDGIPNRYTYAMNNPINNYDPNGMLTFENGDTLTRKRVEHNFETCCVTQYPIVVRDRRSVAMGLIEVMNSNKTDVNHHWTVYESSYTMTGIGEFDENYWGANVQFLDDGAYGSAEAYIRFQNLGNLTGDWSGPDIRRNRIQTAYDNWDFGGREAPNTSILDNLESTVDPFYGGGWTQSEPAPENYGSDGPSGPGVPVNYYDLYDEPKNDLENLDHAWADEGDTDRLHFTADTHLVAINPVIHATYKKRILMHDNSSVSWSFDIIGEN